MVRASSCPPRVESKVEDEVINPPAVANFNLSNSNGCGGDSPTGVRSLGRIWLRLLSTMVSWAPAVRVESWNSLLYVMIYWNPLKGFCDPSATVVAHDARACSSRRPSSDVSRSPVHPGLAEPRIVGDDTSADECDGRHRCAAVNAALEEVVEFRGTDVLQLDVRSIATHGRGNARIARFDDRGLGATAAPHQLAMMVGRVHRAGDVQ
jgi:hypothetical protein